MNTTLIEIMYFILPLVILAVLVKYAFKANIHILLPSAALLLLYVTITICASFTSNKFETTLFTLFCILQLLTLAGSIIVLSKQEIVWKHFFISLPFQFFYWAQLFYYGGLQFTHKF